MSEQEQLNQIKKELRKGNPQELGRLWKERSKLYYKCTPKVTISDYDVLNTPLLKKLGDQVTFL